MTGNATQALGWSLIHFLWQGALIALVLEVALCAFSEGSSKLRYGLRCGALGLMGLMPIGTFLWLWNPSATAPALPLPFSGNLEEFFAAAEQLRANGDAVAAGNPVMNWLVALWAVGASLFAVRVLRDYIRVRRLQGVQAGEPLSDDWQVRFDRLARRMGVEATVRVIDSAALAAPTVIGWLKPVVMVPARAISGLSVRELELVLAHELAHIRRHDYLVNLVQTALEALLFYHPAVWWVSNGIRAEREFCCDDAALDVSRDGVVYARALATLEGWRSTQPELGLSTLGGPLMTRIQRLIGVRPSSRPVRGPLTALGVLLLVGGATAFTHAPIEPQDPEKLEALRKHIEVMEQQIADLKVMLAEATGDEAAVVSVGEVVVPGAFQGQTNNVFTWHSDSDDDSSVQSATGWMVDDADAEQDVVIKVESVDGENFWAQLDGDTSKHIVTLEERLHGDHGDDNNNVFVYGFGDDDGEGSKSAHDKVVKVLTKLHGKNSHIGKLHEHVGELLGEEHAEAIHEHLGGLFGHEDDVHVEGEATFEIHIQRDGETVEHIRKRLPLSSKSSKSLFKLKGKNSQERRAVITGQDGKSYEVLIDPDDGVGGMWLHEGDGDADHVIKLRTRIGKAVESANSQPRFMLKGSKGTKSTGLSEIIELRRNEESNGQRGSLYELSGQARERAERARASASITRERAEQARERAAVIRERVIEGLPGRLELKADTDVRVIELQDLGEGAKHRLKVLMRDQHGDDNVHVIEVSPTTQIRIQTDCEVKTDCEIETDREIETDCDGETPVIFESETEAEVV